MRTPRIDRDAGQLEYLSSILLIYGKAQKSETHVKIEKISELMKNSLRGKRKVVNLRRGITNARERNR